MISQNRTQHRSANLRISSPKLNVENCASIASEGKSLITAGAKELVIDVSEVTFVDSSGIGALVSLRKKIGEDGRVVLLNPQAFVLKVLSLIRMNDVFEIRTTGAPRGAAYG
ncbi:MAG: STAS domain-containing protein [Paracoccaceae bacterium]